MHACFNYKGEFKTLEIAGDFTDWKPVVLKNHKEKDGNLIDCFNFSKSARVEYKLIVDGKWITDPLNPNKVDNGVGGENSVLTMPDYKPTVWDDERAVPFIKDITELEIDSKKFGKRTVKIYLPSEYYKRGIAPKMPVLYLQDGSEYITRAKAINILENVIDEGKVEPFVIVFIDPQDRMKEYWANDDWAEFCRHGSRSGGREKVFFRHQDRTRKPRSARCVTGRHYEFSHGDQTSRNLRTRRRAERFVLD